MSDATAVDLVLLALRVGIGFAMFAHGFNHAFRGGKIPGAGRWFASMGMRYGLVQGWLATLTELGSGPLIVAGLLTPLGAAAVVGITFVAFAIHHRKNGFFIFRPGEGYEYVMVLGLAGLALGTVGPGRWSLDQALGIRDDLTGAPGLLLTAALGLGGALLLLAATWRPVKE
ncbi:MAG: putative oxidoreductase [Actinomycetota bacterium]|nr:putative oxidoreductase [Actinomycetota bacterium]